MVISDSKQKIGLLGGTFDPVHNGHIAAAELALQVLDLHQVRLIPSNLPNPDYKETAAASSRQRLQMLALASADNPRLVVDDIELRRGQISYTVDTLTQLRTRFAEAELVFILGIDSFNTLPAWHRWEEVLQLARFLVFSRPGYAVDAATEGLIGLDQRRVNTAAELFQCGAGKVLLIDSLAKDIASSGLRRKVMADESVSGLVDDKVLEYIRAEGLYQSHTGA